MSEALTAQERRHLLDGLERTAAAFVTAAEAVPADRWKPGPESGKWSPGQIAEHLVLVEQQLIGMLQNELLKSPAVERSPDQSELDERIPIAVLDPQRRPEAPPTMRPTGRWLDRTEVLTHFRSERDRTVAYIRDTNDPLRGHRVARPGLGRLDGYHWLLLLIAHTERHTRQLQSE
ncbi:MAG TPA: DinB family protein [Bryobacteraceae bacterium]|nr:DinB family protein [Bryobacteraceae bacterium]